LNKFRGGVDRALEALLAILMAGMVLAVLWQVFARFILRAPSSVTEELVRFGLIWLGLLGASYGFGKRSHLAIDLLARSLRRRQRVVLSLAVEVLVVAFAFLVLIFGGARLVELTLALGQSSAALQIERGYVYLALPLSGAFILFYATLAAIEELRRLREA
jgi:TRAP-type C4-dicarboxylate transport system permease small subunit